MECTKEFFEYFMGDYRKNQSCDFPMSPPLLLGFGGMFGTH